MARLFVTICAPASTSDWAMTTATSSVIVHPQTAVAACRQSRSRTSPTRPAPRPSIVAPLLGHTSLLLGGAARKGIPRRLSVGITSLQVPDYKGNGGEGGIRSHCPY